MIYNIEEQESNFLNNAERLLISLLEDHSKLNRNEIDVFSERRLKDIIKRSVQNEQEFLREDPAMYADLYCRDQNLN